jgi:hypothetical protein
MRVTPILLPRAKRVRILRGAAHDPCSHRIREDVACDVAAGLAFSQNTLEEARLPQSFVVHTLEPKAARLLPARDEVDGPCIRRQAFDQYMRVIRHEAVGKNCHIGSRETNQELLAHFIDDAVAGEVWDAVPGADAEVITLASDVRECIQAARATDVHVAATRKWRAGLRCRAEALPHGVRALVD